MALVPPRVRVMSHDPANQVTFGPTFSDRMTAGSGLTELGCGFMEFAETGTTEPWTLPYEEVLLVLSGSLDLDVVEDGATERVTAEQGQIVTLAKGSTVTYGGSAGTRLYWSMVPQDWHVAAGA